MMTTHPDRPHVDSLGILFEACIETMTDLWSDALAAIPEPDRPAALAAGKVGTIGPVLGAYLAALHMARDGAYLEALALIRNAIRIGFDPYQAREVIAFIYRGIAADLRVPGFAKALFTPSSLALVRWIEAKTHYPCAPERGVETDIVVVEQRPLAEIREVFTQPFLAEVPVGAGQDGYLDRLLENANDSRLEPSIRAQSIINMAAIALAADDFAAAVSLVAQAVRLAPDDDSAGISACFMWLAINAAGHTGKLDSRTCPAWPDVVAVLHGVLGYDTRHPNGSLQAANSDGGIIAAQPGQQSL